MINKEDSLKTLTCSLLDCGSLDLDFLLDTAETINNNKFMIKGEEQFLFDFARENILEVAYDNVKDYANEVSINSLIYEVLSCVAKRINEIYDIEMEEGKDYKIYTNCLDSHLSLNDDFTETHDEESEISKEEQDEIKAIIENFN
jgi:hypothetical protein